MSFVNPRKLNKRPALCHHVGIFVHDLKKMSDFYTRRLGFCFEREYQADEKIMKIIFGINAACLIRYYLRDGFRIELFYFLRQPLNRRTQKILGLNHWALVVDDRAGFCRDLKKKGAPVIKIVKPSGEFTLFTKDPESNLIEIRDG